MKASGGAPNQENAGIAAGKDKKATARIEHSMQALLAAEPPPLPERSVYATVTP
ncbi:hypothetical protein [Paraburkholderia pallida]|uniref:hypothetical protein n=1 Tax=Paraburkholderia pallida TaxID=2547399 RepID=UPI0014314C0D|nr:hypothetical protein [Paraburkholderia pallida]